MANAKQQPVPLTYRIKNLATAKAACERFTVFGKGSSGTFRNTATLFISQLPGSSNELELSMEVTVTGQPKESEDGQIAFQATCKVSCFAEFSEDQGEDLADPLFKELTAPIFYVALERCRELVTSMGFPNPAITLMRPMQAVKPNSEPDTQIKPKAKLKRARSTLGNKETTNE